jgi:hypothetical protein
MGKSAELANELQCRCANFFLGRRGLKIEERLDISAHLVLLQRLRVDRYRYGIDVASRSSMSCNLRPAQMSASLIDQRRGADRAEPWPIAL